MANDENVVSEEQQKSDITAEEQTAMAGQNQESGKDLGDKASKDTPKQAESEEKEPVLSRKEKKAVDKLQKELEGLKAKADDNWNEYLRACAELENTKRRMQRDIENANKFAVEKFVLELLPVKDSLEMGLAAAKDQNGGIEKLLEGTELTLKMFSDAVAKFGIETVDPIDQPFDPEFHQAMSMQESASKPPNTVIAVMQKGYTLHGRLVRPAMVVVSKAQGNVEKPQDQGDQEKVGTNIDEQA